MLLYLIYGSMPPPNVTFLPTILFFSNTYLNCDDIVMMDKSRTIIFGGTLGIIGPIILSKQEPENLVLQARVKCAK